MHDAPSPQAFQRGQGLFLSGANGKISHRRSPHLTSQTHDGNKQLSMAVPAVLPDSPDGLFFCMRAVPSPLAFQQGQVLFLSLGQMGIIRSRSPHLMPQALDGIKWPSLAVPSVLPGTFAVNFRAPAAGRYRSLGQDFPGNGLPASVTAAGPPELPPEQLPPPAPPGAPHRGRAVPPPAAGRPGRFPGLPSAAPGQWREWA